MWEDLGVITRLRFLSRKTVILYEPLYHYNRRNDSSLTRDSKHGTKYFLAEQVKCAKELESFFQQHNVYKPYFLFIQNIKFAAKLSLLRNGYYSEWLNLFPETHPYIWNFDGSFSRRFKYFLATHKIFLTYEIRKHLNARRHNKQQKN
jgi:hypothetical protein